MKDLLTFTVPGGTSIDPIAGMPSGGTDAVQRVIQSGITYLFVAATLLALFFLIFGGIQWIMSSGEKEKIEAARKRIIYAILGLLIAFLSFFIINTIGTFFSVKLLDTPGPVCSNNNPSGTCPGIKTCTYFRGDYVCR